MADHFVQIYAEHGSRYHELIAAEDVEGNLLQALKQATDLGGKRVLDLGSGTGRIPWLLNEVDCEIVSLELYRDMLREQKKHLGDRSGRYLAQGDLRELPLAGQWADLATAGWAIGHFCGWYGEHWKREAARALGEIKRAVKAEGTLMIFETMGTGTDAAGPPTPALTEYYAWLEEQGFKGQVISTDYDFGSVARAADLCGFFFGEELEAKVRERAWSRVPEWTGIWQLRLS